MYTVAVPVFAVFALLFGLWTFACISASRKHNSARYDGKGKLRITRSAAIKGIHDYQDVLAMEGRLNMKQLDTFERLCQIVGVDPNTALS